MNNFTYDIDKLLLLAIELRDELNAFVELFDENDPKATKLISEFDDFIGGVELVNRSKIYNGE